MKLRNLLLMCLFLGASVASANSMGAGTLAKRSAGFCTSDADCSGHGTCTLSTGECKCDALYITPNNGGGQCSYAAKSQLEAFLLQLFLGEFGAGEFYAGNYGWAAGQLVVTLSIIPTAIAAVCLGGLTAMKSGGAGAVVAAILGLVLLGEIGTTFAWWLADTIMWGIGTRTDGNGQKAYKNM